MHHFIYSKSNSYITNNSEYYLRNFGRDEELEISSELIGKYIYENAIIQTTGSTEIILCKTDCFSGMLTGSLSGSAESISGSIYIPCPDIYITSPPAPIINQFYDYIVQAIGGASPYTFEVVSGETPYGIHFLSTGEIIGQTTVGGQAYHFTLRATDKCGCHGDFVITWTIACNTLQLSTILSPECGQEYSQTIITSFGTPPYTYSLSGSLPYGLSLDTSTGTISGNTIDTGTFDFTISSTDVNGCFGSNQYEFVLACCPTLMWESSILEPCIVTIPYSASFTASGGTPPYEYYQYDGQVPDNLTLNLDGSITGTPITLQTSSFTVGVIDSIGCTGYLTSSIVVTMNPLLIGGILPDDFIEDPSYSAVISASGGMGGYNFSVTDGSTPDGITVNSDGTVTGMPVAVGKFNFTVTVTDSYSNMASGSFQINILPITLSLDNTLPTGSVGYIYNGLIIASGGLEPYTYSVTSISQPPDGLIVNSDGTVTGIPTTEGLYPFVVTAVDLYNQSGSQSYDVLITPHCYPCSASCTIDFDMYIDWGIDPCCTGLNTASQHIHTTLYQDPNYCYYSGYVYPANLNGVGIYIYLWGDNLTFTPDYMFGFGTTPISVDGCSLGTWVNTSGLISANYIPCCKSIDETAWTVDPRDGCRYTCSTCGTDQLLSYWEAIFDGTNWTLKLLSTDTNPPEYESCYGTLYINNTITS